ncbi:hypothetical protein [Streptomyces sp. NBC_01622]|uniref:hypothetical protein n=1 Tax=Streptomyces sp. NBC_01622 TaxID=2975903 RepID=UPI00386A050F
MGTCGQSARVLGKFLDNGRRHTVTAITAPLARAGDDGRAGLGLAIARDVVRNHGGDLTVTEAPSGSTAFLLALSRATRTPTTRTPDRTPLPTPDTRRPGPGPPQSVAAALVSSRHRTTRHPHGPHNQGIPSR